MTVLFGRSRNDVTLSDAISSSDLEGGLALLSSPTAHQVCVVRAGACLQPEGADVVAVDPSEVFEARLFDADREMRWLHVGGGVGRAVLLSENEILLPDTFDHELAPLSAHDTHDQHYLLWGQAVPGSPRGWTRLSSARIGSFAVPLPEVGAGLRARLRAREYVAVEPRHGNAYIAEERLMGLERYEPPEQGHRRS